MRTRKLERGRPKMRIGGPDGRTIVQINLGVKHSPGTMCAIPGRMERACFQAPRRRAFAAARVPTRGGSSHIQILGIAAGFPSVCVNAA